MSLFFIIVVISGDYITVPACRAPRIVFFIIPFLDADVDADKLLSVSPAFKTSWKLNSASWNFPKAAHNAINKMYFEFDFSCFGLT